MRPILLSLVLLSCCLPLAAQENGCTGPTFAQLFRDTTGRYVRLTSVIPYRGSPTDLLIGGMADGDVFLSRIDREGNVRWRRSFSTGSESTELTTLNTVLIDADGMIAGVGNDFHADRQHGFLFRYDPLGDRLLYLVQPDIDSELTGLAEAPGNTYLTTGAALDLPPPLFSRALTQRLHRGDGSPAGPVTLLDVAGEENPLDLIPHPDGGYLVAGNASLSDAAGSTRALLLRLDDNGLPVTAQIGPVAENVNARLYAFDVEVVGNLTYLLQWGDIGKLTGAENTSAILTAFDRAGLPLWTQRFDVDDFTGETGIELVVQDDGLLIYGFSLDGARDLFLLRVTATGTLTWAKRYSLPGRAQVYQRASQQLLADAGGIWLTATSSFSGARPHEGVLLHLDPAGNSDNACLEIIPLTVSVSALAATWRPLDLTEEEVDLAWNILPPRPAIPALVSYDDCDLSCEPCSARSFSSEAICAGDSVLVGDRWITTPGVIIDTVYTPGLTCDSVVITEVVESAGPSATYRLTQECGLNTARVTIAPTGGVPPYSYTWSDTSITGVSPLLPAGNYTVTVNDRADCRPLRLGVVVTILADGGTSYTALPPSCAGSSDGAIVLSPPGTASLKLLQDTTFTPDRIDGLAPGNYSFILRTASGCEVYREATIEAPVPLTVRLTGPQRVRLGDPVEFTAVPSNPTDDLRFSWTPSGSSACPGCATQTFLLPRDTLITVTAANAAGCTATDSTYLRTDASLPRLYLATAFSPNGDGTNDTWVPGFGPEVTDILLWEVYDRWGTLAWAYDPNQPSYWTGGDAGAGVYVYRMQVRLINGTTTTRSGEVTLIR